MDNLKTFLFFQVDVVADLKVDDVIYSDIKQRNNDSVITPENWEAKKETFFEQRMETYKDSYSITEKINLELKLIDEMQIESNDYTVIRERYRQYLMNWSITKPTKQEEPVTFKSLFHDERMAPACIDVLKNCEPPLIDENCRYIGKEKSALCLWIELLERNGFIKKQSDRKVYAKMLALTFDDLSISDSLFAKTNSRAKLKYEHQMKHKFHEIKLLKNEETNFHLT
jgi:hypothetical protein